VYSLIGSGRPLMKSHPAPGSDARPSNQTVGRWSSEISRSAPTPEVAPYSRA